MTAAGYASVEELKDWLGEDTGYLDQVLEQQILAASRWIDSVCGRRFYREPEADTDPPVARVYDAVSPWELRIDDAREITGIATDDDADGIHETIWLPGDWQAVHPSVPTPEDRPIRRIRAVGSRMFPSRVRRAGLVEVTGRWGWETIPAPVHEACLLQASRLLKRRHSPEGITGFGNEFGHIRISTRDDPDVVAMLRPYMLRVFLA